MIKLEIEYVDEKQVNTYNIDKVEFLCEEMYLEIPGVVPHYVGQIRLISTDMNLINYLNTFDSISKLSTNINRHKYIMTSYFTSKNISINCNPYYVSIDYDGTPRIIIDCNYRTPFNKVKEAVGDEVK